MQSLLLEDMADVDRKSYADADTIQVSANQRTLSGSNSLGIICYHLSWLITNKKRVVINISGFGSHARIVT